MSRGLFSFPALGPTEGRRRNTRETKSHSLVSLSVPFFSLFSLFFSLFSLFFSLFSLFFSL
ncbi:polyprenyl synthetase superfamily protein, partial [Toxoplasma gondii ARI]